MEVQTKNSVIVLTPPCIIMMLISLEVSPQRYVECACSSLWGNLICFRHEAVQLLNISQITQCRVSVTSLPSVLDEKLGIVPAKSLMTFYAEKMSSLKKGVAKAVCEHTLSRLQSRIVSFEEQVSLALHPLHTCTHKNSNYICRPFTILTTLFQYPIENLGGESPQFLPWHTYFNQAEARVTWVPSSNSLESSV